LLVEDDVGLQKQMQWSQRLQNACRDDAASALTIFRRETPRLVIVDLGLPPLPDEATEGLKLIEAILVLEPATKIIVASGNQDRQNAVRAVGLGAYDFFAADRSRICFC
jgi:two-component system NtrC family response regulator